MDLGSIDQLIHQFGMGQPSLLGCPQAFADAAQGLNLKAHGLFLFAQLLRINGLLSSKCKPYPMSGIA